MRGVGENRGKDVFCKTVYCINFKVSFLTFSFVCFFFCLFVLRRDIVNGN